MSYYQRNLPHWHPDGAALFITWRLHGSLPSSNWGLRKDAADAFREMDRVLDQAVSGPLWLKDPRVAKCVTEAMRHGDEQLGLYELIAFAVMANHVHILIQPKSDLARITKAIKGFTAREANKILGRTGEPFWQDESFDRWVRDQDELNRTIRYIENNPVAAGLIEQAEDHPWSSANQKSAPARMPVPRSRGVTLIEMLIVVAIIGLMAAISFPSVASGVESLRISSASDSLVAFLNGGLNRAERRQQPVEISISLKDNAVYLHADGLSRELDMPPGVTILAVLPKLPVEIEGPRQFLLLPGSTAPRIGILIQNRKGTRRIVRVNPMTGVPEIERLAPEDVVR